MSPWWYVWSGVCAATMVWYLWDHGKDYDRRERLLAKNEEALLRLRGRVDLLESRCDAISSSVDPGITTLFSDEFTCPKCGAHQFGLYTEPSTMRYCRGADGVSNCGYRWPAVDDHLYFLPNESDKSLS